MRLANPSMKFVLYQVNIPLPMQFLTTLLISHVVLELLDISCLSLRASVITCSYVLSGKLTGIIFINSGLASFESQFKDSSNATFIKLTAALFAPSTKNKVFQ